MRRALLLLALAASCGGGNSPDWKYGSVRFYWATTDFSVDGPGYLAHCKQVLKSLPETTVFFEPTVEETTAACGRKPGDWVAGCAWYPGAAWVAELPRTDSSGSPDLYSTALCHELAHLEYPAWNHEEPLLSQVHFTREEAR